MSIITWIILGLLAGAIAKAIVPGHQGGGWLATMVLGVVGAFIGGSLHSLLQTGTLQIAATSLTVPGVAIAVLGAIIAIFIYGALARNT
ncbi:MAG: GlsB/YeaQ/YmgE family stress response membrane protein [Microcoleaceae cyanobacterium]